MPKVVGVRFKKTGKIYYFLAGDICCETNDRVIVETQQGQEIAKIVLAAKSMESTDLPDDLKMVVRKADSKDLSQAEKNLEDADKAFQTAKEKIKQHHLDMKLVHAVYAFDRSKIVFSFTADGRVDFRELVRDLAGIFKTRIELRQIGVRDEAKMLGGIGPCGRQLCCSTFLGDFMPVSIKMAKDQNLSLNPTKISGLCGRLMCCLKYENDEYEAAKKEMPDYGTMVTTPDGAGRVCGLNLLSRIVKVKLKGRETPLEYTLEELRSGASI